MALTEVLIISPSTTQALVFVLSALLFSLAKEAWEGTKKPSCKFVLEAYFVSEQR